MVLSRKEENPKQNVLELEGRIRDALDCDFRESAQNAYKYAKFKQNKKLFSIIFIRYN